VVDYVRRAVAASGWEFEFGIMAPEMPCENDHNEPTVLDELVTIDGEIKVEWEAS
jgi:hypothetical protein